MSKPLDELYLTWLYRQVASVSARNPSRTYWSLLRQLYTKEFVWLIPNDDNRVEDGVYLRIEFMQDNEVDVPEEWFNLGCSMLEMLIALSRRLAFETEGRPKEWFWRLIENLELEAYNDDVYAHHIASAVEETLDRVIWRNYDENGVGGLFPLQNSQTDQRRAELWYQMSAWIQERY